jgi:hypothetical protein
MSIPKKAPLKVKIVLCTVFSALHGLFFGVLYMPFQIIMYNLNFEMTIAWLSAGVVFDVIHMVGNIAMCSLIYPLYKTLIRLEESREKKNYR